MGTFASWLPEEEHRFRSGAPEPGTDPAVERAWIRAYYFQPNPVAYVEYGTLAVAILALALAWSG